jgi:hypothetical protein
MQRLGEGMRESWRPSKVRGSDEQVTWRPVVATRSLCFGLDRGGRWLSANTASGEVILGDQANLLFFIPLLEIDHDEFVRQLSVSNTRAERALEFMKEVVQVALRERSESYLESALKWCGALRPSVELRAALLALAESKRGTQSARQLARRLARQHEAP